MIHYVHRMWIVPYPSRAHKFRFFDAVMFVSVFHPPLSLIIKIIRLKGLIEALAHPCLQYE